MDAQGAFLVDKNGNYAGTMITLAGDPRVDFNTAMGIVRARSSSPHHTAFAWTRVSDVTREEFNDYFSALFELAQANDSFTA